MSLFDIILIPLVGLLCLLELLGILFDIIDPGISIEVSRSFGLLSLLIAGSLLVSAATEPWAQQALSFAVAAALLGLFSVLVVRLFATGEKPTLLTILLNSVALFAAVLAKAAF